MDAERAARSGTIAPAALLALLALPFDPGWIDFETARSGVLLLVAGALALRCPRWYPASLPAGAVPLALLCGLYLLRSIGVVNGFEALLRSAHWVALTVLFVWGSGRRPDDVLRAGAAVGLVVAAYGTAQAIGLDWPTGYARAGEPVSTLGNRNVASEFATFALACAAALAGRGSRGALAAAVMIGAYVGLNGTRAGLVGALLAIGIVAAASASPRRRVGALGAIALAVLAAYFGRPAAPELPPATTDNVATAGAIPSTIDVRVELWRGSVAMIADAPLLGHGSGQFRYRYPEYRSEAEIELSSFGRRFPTYAESPHDDPLEIAVETGIPGLLLALWFLAAAARRALQAGGVARAATFAPLAAFAIAALVRAPLGNAPAAAAAFALLGALAARDPSRAPRSATRTLGSLALGLALIAAGVSIVVAASSAARWTGGGASSWIDRTVGWHGSESRYRSLRILDRCGGVDETGFLVRHGPAEYAACREDVAALARLDPNNTNALLLTAQLALGAGAREAARAALGRVLTLDPREPRAQLLAALSVAQDGEAADAVATLYAHPHPTLRARLAATLTALAAVPELDAAGRRLLEHEARFVTAVDATAADPRADATQRAILAFVAAAGFEDHRARALLARQKQARGDDAEAEALAPPAVELGAAVRELLAPVLEPLRALPAWDRACAGS